MGAPARRQHGGGGGEGQLSTRKKVVRSLVFPREPIINHISVCPIVCFGVMRSLLKAVEFDSYFLRCDMFAQ